MTAHVDFCHWFSSSFVCDHDGCNATAVTRYERDVAEDPYSAVWMDPEDRGGPCSRCDELLAGAEPTRFEPEITEPSK